MSDLYRLLLNCGLECYGELLTSHGFNAENIADLCSSDLQKLRVSNRRDKQRLLEVAAAVRERLNSSVVVDSKLIEPRKRSATEQTAADCCRQAQCYIEHHREDRAWPKPSSLLSATIGLSNITPRPPSSYRIWAPKIQAPLVFHTDNVHLSVGSVVKEVITVNHTIKQAASLDCLRCSTCHGINGVTISPEALRWQYQTVSKTGSDHVKVWKNFIPKHSLAIEIAFQRHDKWLDIGDKIVTFESMRWGKKPIKRSGALEFALSPREKSSAGEVPSDLKVKLDTVRSKFAENQFHVIVDQQSYNRQKILFDEQETLRGLLTAINATMVEFFISQQERLQILETEARTPLFVDFVASLEKLRVRCAEDLRKVSFVQRNAPVLMAGETLAREQRQLVEQMEQIMRQAIRREEEEEYQFVWKQIIKFNADVRGSVSAAMSVTEEVRCMVCHKASCSFFCNKWQNYWTHQETEKKRKEGGGTTVANLMADVRATEYEEHFTHTSSIGAVISRTDDTKARAIQRIATRPPFRCGSATPRPRGKNVKIL